jgi:hypothetical protein
MRVTGSLRFPEVWSEWESTINNLCLIENIGRGQRLRLRCDFGVPA